MKTVLIMRGLPGSGKSSFVKEVVDNAKFLNFSVSVCSADDFRYVDGKYTFVSSAVPHQQCYDKFKKSLDDEVEIVIVDNTNCTTRSMKPYVKYALEKGYKIEFKAIQPIDLETLFKRNIHNVPMESIERMFRRWVPNPTIEEILAGGSELS